MVMTPVGSADPSICPCSRGCCNGPRAATLVTLKAALNCLLLSNDGPVLQQKV